MEGVGGERDNSADVRARGIQMLPSSSIARRKEDKKFSKIKSVGAANAFNNPGFKPNPRIQIFERPGRGGGSMDESNNFSTFQMQEKCSVTFDMKVQLLKESATRTLQGTKGSLNGLDICKIPSL